MPISGRCTTVTSPPCALPVLTGGVALA